MGKRLLTLTAFLIFSSFAIINAQLSLIWEPYVIHDYPTLADAPGGDADIFALDGYITWRLYAHMEYGDPNTPDYLTSVLGSGSPDLETLQITFDCCPYQHPQGSFCGCNISPVVIGIIPVLAFDSWVTLGMENNDVPGSLNFLPEPPIWTDDFNNCTGLQIFDDSFNGSAWFTLPGTANGYPDENDNVLIGQFTVPVGCQLIEQGDGDSGSLCINYFEDGDFDLDTGTDCIAIPPLNPCFNNPISSNLVDSTAALCFGICDGTAQFDFSGGSEDLMISIDQVDAVGDGAGLFSELCAGEHVVTITDNITIDDEGLSCFITDTVTIPEPLAAVSASLTVVTDVACANDSIGVVDIIVSGGTPYTIGDAYIGTTGYGVNYEFIAPDIIRFDSLSIEAGIEFSVLDSNGCEVSFTQDIGPIGALTASGEATNVSCFEAADGSILLTIDGGSPDPSITWTPAVNSDLNPTGLAPGNYSVIIDDGDSCPIELSFDITEPDVFTLDNVIPDHIDCFDTCTGSVTFDTNGGTGAVSATFIQGVSNVLNNEFCAGDVIIEVRDENQCFATQTVLIAEGDEIVFNALVTEITCPSGTNGSICLENLEGGSGPVILSINPVIPFDDLSSCFLNVGPGNFIISAIDSLNCQSDTLIAMAQPSEFIPTITSTDVTCNGLDDGTITIQILGGSGEINYLINNAGLNSDGLFSDLAPGFYTLSGSDAAGCPFEVADQVEITEPTLISITDLALTSPGCGGESTGTASVSVDGGTPGYLIGWNSNPPAPNNNLVLELSGGANSVQITDANNCLLDSTFLMVEPEEIQIVSSVQDVECTGMCNGSFDVIPSSGLEPLTVDYGNINNDLLCEGIYPIVVTDSLGCIFRDTITVGSLIDSDIEYTVFTTPVSCWNEADGTATIAVIGGQPPIEYDWRKDDITIQTNSTAIGLIEDFYTITITDALGCTFIEEVFIDPTEGCFYISNALTPNGDGANDEWIIGGLEYFPEAKVEVFNRWGQQVFESIGSYTNWDGKFNSNRLPVSDYYYVITFDPDSPPLTGTVTIKY